MMQVKQTNYLILPKTIEDGRIEFYNENISSQRQGILSIV
jgi:hypothetical protein